VAETILIKPAGVKNNVTLGGFMKLWTVWFSVVKTLREACSRKRTFLWMVVFLMGVSMRCGDLAGVTSIIRILGLCPGYYTCLLDFLHSPSLNCNLLARLWTQTVFSHFHGRVTINGRAVVLSDGIKIPKEGKKMPGVKSLHQESESNTKPEYIMGHSCQAIGLVVKALGSFFCVPLVAEIHEGVVLSNANKKTLYDKLLNMFVGLGIQMPCYFVADAYYSVAKMVVGLKNNGHHLVTRAKKNIVAYQQEPVNNTQKKRGRPKKYGGKIKLNKLFKKKALFKTMQSPIEGEKNVTLEYYSVQLLWRSCGELIQFVLVKHPKHGSAIFVTTDLECDPATVITLYSFRFKIEVAFKQSLHTIGTFSYHFWMKVMDPINRGDGNQHLHRKTKKYRAQVETKIAAYHRFIQLGLIAQGILQYLSVHFHELVWKHFGSWIRTTRSDVPPSEWVTSMALKNSLPKFLANSDGEPTFKKFITERIDLGRAEGFRLFN